MLEYIRTKRENTTIKTNNRTREDKSEDNGERSRDMKKTIQTKQDIHKQQKNLPASWRRMHKDIPTARWPGSKTIL